MNDRKDKPYMHADWLKEQVSKGIKAKDIAADMRISKCTVFSWASRLGVAMVMWNARTRKYTFDQHYLDTIDNPDKAYMLGLIAADGTVLNTGWEMRIKLRTRDADVLKQLHKLVNIE